jgi:hypothetical protein
LTLDCNIDTSSTIIYWACFQTSLCFFFNFPTLFPLGVSIGMETAVSNVVPPILTATASRGSHNQLLVSMVPSNPHMDGFD